jgi:hypothetical protein
MTTPKQWDSTERDSIPTPLATLLIDINCFRRYPLPQERQKSSPAMFTPRSPRDLFESTPGVSHL